MTELIWEGKYDKDGRKVAPLRVALPFQTVETVNESPQQRQTALDMFSEGRDSEWRNRLIWGDKKYVLPSLLPEFAGKVNLIYIDPPFDTGANFSFTTTIPDSGLSMTKEPSMIEQKAYRDTWGKGLDSYLKWFYETAVFMRELLADDGSIYIHLDWHIGHSAKLILDEVFGSDNFINEIIWHYKRWPANSNNFQKMHDTIFLYGKGSKRTFNVQLQELTDGTNRRWRGQKSKVEFVDGVRQVTQMTAEKSEGTPQDDVWNIPVVNSQALERVEYATQKPEALIERIIEASSNEGDLVLDCFCGSGTTAATAEKLRRRWITCDLGRFAIHTARKRLLGIPHVKPFIVQNLGKYERQVWQTAEFGDNAAVIQQRYREFILDLYHARPLAGYVWLHGLKNGRMVHVGSVDSPVTVGDVTQIIAEFRKAQGTGTDAPTENGIDLLGWDFAFEINEVAKQQAIAANIRLRFYTIPREILEKKAVEQGDIRFFEKAALVVNTQQTGRSLTLTLEDFVLPVDDVPADIQKAISHWSQWIDYWAVDFDNKNDTFHNEWQSYRRRKDPSLQLTKAHQYPASGTYQVVVKVIDILGNDTTKTLTVTIP